MSLFADFRKEQQRVEELVGVRSTDKEDRPIFGDIECSSRPGPSFSITSICPANPGE